MNQNAQLFFSFLIGWVAGFWNKGCFYEESNQNNESFKVDSKATT